MRFSPKPATALALLSFLVVPFGAWLVFGAHLDPFEAPARPAVEGKASPVFWDPAPSSGQSDGAVMTHGGWFCANPECRFLKMSGGQSFRSAKPQNCSLCRHPLVQDRPVAAVPSGREDLTAPGGG